MGLGLQMRMLISGPRYVLWKAECTAVGLQNRRTTPYCRQVEIDYDMQSTRGKGSTNMRYRMLNK